MLLRRLRYEHRERQRDACDHKDAPERQEPAVRSPCPAHHCACRRPLVHERLLNLLQRPSVSVGEAGIGHGAQHRRPKRDGRFRANKLEAVVAPRSAKPTLPWISLRR